MKTKQISKIEVLRPSHELFYKLIKEFPDKPQRATIVFDAHGLLLPHNRTNKEDESYINQCHKKGVIPYSQIEFGYEGGIFRPPTHGANYPVSFHAYSRVVSREISEGFLQGGKIHEITIDIYRHQSGFKPLQEEFLDEIVKQGYDIRRGNFILGDGPVGTGEHSKPMFSFDNGKYESKIGFKNCQIDASSGLGEWLKNQVVGLL